MTETNIGRWLLAGIAILGLVIVIPAISAHGNGTQLDNETAADGTYGEHVDDRAVWMAEHMEAHMGPNASEWNGNQTEVNTTEWLNEHWNVSEEEFPHHVTDGWQGMPHDAHADHHAGVDWNDDEHDHDAHTEDVQDDSDDTHDGHIGDDHDEYADSDAGSDDDHDERGHGGMHGRGHGC